MIRVRRALFAAAMAAIPVAGGAQDAQTRPPAAPPSAQQGQAGPAADAAEAAPAPRPDGTRPPDRPSDRGDVPRPDRPPPQGRLIPPDAPRDGGDARPQGGPAPTGGSAPTEPAPGPAATQTVPVDGAAPAGATTRAQPAKPLGPPMRRILRETDFAYSACLLSLARLGARYEELKPVTDPEQRDCGIARPLRVTEILPGVTLDGGAVMRCDTARALGRWARDVVQPALGRLPGAPVLTGMVPGTTYECRGRVGTGASGDRLSEHAFGNAIDIAAFAVTGGEPLAVSPRDGSGDLAEAVQRAARGGACLYFTTVLGPGSNAAHAGHLHLDVAIRRGGWRLCE